MVEWKTPVPDPRENPNFPEGYQPQKGLAPQDV